jgi:hypothetical protein
MPHRLRAVAFDVDAASLTSLRDALPGWQVEVVNGATASSLTHGWNPGMADLLVVQARGELAETLGLCRLLVSCSGYSTDSRGAAAEPPRPHGGWQGQVRPAGAPLLVLVVSQQDPLVSAALEAGADHCLVLPIHAKDVASMLAHARQDSQPGRHTTNLDRDRSEDLWRDDGGQG